MERVVKERRLNQENTQLKRALDDRFGFENIVGHSNRNLFRGYLHARKGQNIDLAPYVRQAMLTASDETLLRMVKLKELTITADDVRTVRYARSREVQSAYCSRAPEACPQKR